MKILFACKIKYKRKALITYFIGKILPVNIYVEISWVLDVLLIIVSALLWKIERA